MHIILYKSAFCPRCHLAAKYLNEIARQKTDLQIQEIDVLRHPVLALQHGVRFIPTLVIDQQRLVGFFLERKQIEAFICACTVQKE